MTMSGALPKGFDALIEALTIFKKYDNPDYPFNCSHDELAVMIPWSSISEEDKNRLKELGFFGGDADAYTLSYKYGSA